MLQLDCTVNQKICSQNDVKGYPTLMWFAGGRMVSLLPLRVNELLSNVKG